MSIFADHTQKVLKQKVVALAEDGAVVIDARGASAISIIAGAGATVTWSRVDSDVAAEHTTGTENTDTVTAETLETVPVDWPFYRVSSADGTARVALILS